MSQATKCLICRNEHGGACTSMPHGDGDWFTCEICGQFIVTRSLQAVLSHKDDTTFPRPKRAALSHLLRRSWDEHQKPFFMTTTWFDDYLPAARLPTPSEQAINIIRWIGDQIAATALPIPRIGAEFYARIGAATPRAAHKVTEELISRGLITAMVSKAIGAYTHMQDVDLTLPGWAQYESEKRGRFAGLYGFIALKFGDPVLDPFLRDHVKPAIKEHISHDLIDMRDAAKAGIIDNLMREKIRDAAFVLVDLTHENAGAYWEAGYAEGLGKPVLYLCQRAKFDKEKSHFDTNHLTTVLWEADNPTEFVNQLIATLRRSLNLFPSQ